MVLKRAVRVVSSLSSSILHSVFAIAFFLGISGVSRCHLAAIHNHQFGDLHKQRHPGIGRNIHSNSI
jgi:hypothetical protein